MSEAADKAKKELREQVAVNRELQTHFSAASRRIASCIVCMCARPMFASRALTGRARRCARDAKVGRTLTFA
eukprot:5649819-Alexandrium_andersonii.AAC.1